MTVLDSSAWLEFLIGGPHAGRFLPVVERYGDVITPTIVLYEVFKKISRERSEEVARIKVAYLQRTRMVPLTDSLALSAAQLSNTHHLAMADAIIYATALAHNAEILTLDHDFEGLPHATVVKA